MQILRRRAVEERTGLKRSTIYFLMNAKTFPRPIRLGAKAVGWREVDIENWLASRPLAA